MKSILKFALFGLMAACTAHVTDESAAAVNTDGTPSRDSLLARVEALFARGLSGVESLLHDAIGAVEDLFATDDGSTLDVSVSTVEAATAEAPTAEAPTAEAPTAEAAPGNDATFAEAPTAAPATTGDAAS